MSYVEVEAFKNRQGITTLGTETELQGFLESASLEVDSICGRTFTQHDGEPTARDFYPSTCFIVRIDDAYEITSVAIDVAGDGSFSRTIPTSDYVTSPLNGRGVNRRDGWPAEQITVLTSSYTMPRWNRPSVRVTAKWGWAETPHDVIEATCLLANRLKYEVAVPSGVTPANVEFGLPGQALPRPYTAERLLSQYRRVEHIIGVAG